MATTLAPISDVYVLAGSSPISLEELQVAGSAVNYYRLRLERQVHLAVGFAALSVKDGRIELGQRDFA